MSAGLFNRLVAGGEQTETSCRDSRDSCPASVAN
jgi:hypothetical protein